jgi:hypothetical protein
MMKKYCYRFDEKSELGKKFRKFLYECSRASRAADTYCKKAGAKMFYEDPSSFAGGVTCVSFDEEKKVDKKLWRSVGKDTDGIEMYEPNVQHRQDCILITRRDFRPADTDTRIYQKRVSEWIEVVNLHTKQEWIAMSGVRVTGNLEADWQNACSVMQKELFVQYTEIYVDDEQLKQLRENPRYRMPVPVKRAIQLEMQRLKLPVVNINKLYALFQPTLVEEGKKPRVLHASTPVCFLHNGMYYIRSEFPYQNKDLKKIDEAKFILHKIEFEREQDEDD